MRLLLDTHAFLWFVENNRNLSAQALELIKSGSNEVFLSIDTAFDAYNITRVW